MSSIIKCKLITFHTPKNYGAVLQAFSLYSFLKLKCGDTQIVDYNTPELRRIYSPFKKIDGMKSFLYNLKHLHFSLQKRVKNKRFDSFLNKYVSFTKRYESYSDLLKEKWNCSDVFITGSDQVFNPNRSAEDRNAFYLEFVPSSNFKISYAASFGVDNIPIDLLDEIKHKLNSFNSISIRENSGVRLVNDLINKNAVEVLDPVFLHTSDFWKSIANIGIIKKTNNEKYVLYYRLLGSLQGDKFAIDYARDHNCSLVTISAQDFFWLHGKILFSLGPDEFLSYFTNAFFVITDSFHGVAFSLIFNKQFVFTNDKNNNIRGMNLLDKLGIIKEAYISSFCDDSYIDYYSVNQTLSKLIEESKLYIHTALEHAVLNINSGNGNEQE